MQQHLEAKRGALEKSLEQLVGQINRVNGAIAVVDELIAESRERDEADFLGPDMDPIDFGGINREPLPYWKNTDATPHWPVTPLAEMLPVVSGDAEDEQRSAPGAA